MIPITNGADDPYEKDYSTECLYFIKGYTQHRA